MQHQQAAVLDCGINRSGNAIAASHPHFLKLVFQWPDVRQTDMLGAKRFHQFRDVHKPGLQFVGQVFQFYFGQGMNDDGPV